MKKKEDLEAIVDLLHEWCVEYGEPYISACIADGAGTANISVGRLDYAAVDIFKDYKKRVPAAATA